VAVLDFVWVAVVWNFVLVVVFVVLVVIVVRQLVLFVVIVEYPWK